MPQLDNRADNDNVSTEEPLQQQIQCHSSFVTAIDVS